MKRAARRLHAEPAHLKTFLSLIQQLGHSTHRVFADFCEISALSLSDAVDVHQRERREARYLELVKGYRREEVGVFAQLSATTVPALEERMHDFPGRCFPALKRANLWKGQFFTPY